MTGPDELAKEISDCGVPRVFGIPGSGSSLALIDSLEKRNVGFVRPHFEGTAALMAGATAQLCGRISVAISIKGPGLSNMVPGLAACALDRMPMVAIAEAYAADSPGSTVHKRMDHEALVAGVAKGHRYWSETGPTFSALADWSKSDVAGPVVLSLAEPPADADAPIPGPASPPEGDLDKYIAAAERPVVIAGSLAMRTDLGVRLSDLNVPVFTTAAAKGVIDETRPHAAGVYTGVGLDYTPEAALLPQADLVVGIGLRNNEVLKVGRLPCSAVNFDIRADGVSAGFDFVATAASGLERLADKSWGIPELEACRSALRTHLLARPFLPSHVFDGLQQHFGVDACMVFDTGNFCTVGEHMWAVARPDRYLATAQGRYMGTSVPLAIAAALHDKSIPTIAAVGDGGIGMYFTELKLAVAYRLPLIVVFMCDGGFSSIRAGARMKGLSERCLVSDDPSFRAAAEGLGLRAEMIANEADLRWVLENWSKADGPLFLEVVFDPDAALSMVQGVR